MASLAEEEPNETIDEELYSRQLYVLGAVAQRKLQRSRVLVSGNLSGVGAELCKNVVLAGVNALTLHDDGVCTSQDLSAAGFLVSEHDVQRASLRSEGFLQELREMNANVQVQRVSGDPDFNAFDVVVLVNAPFSRILRVSAALHAGLTTQKSKLIVTGAYGLISYCFCDFGTSWTVHDTDGEVTRSGLILNASQVVSSRELEISTEAPHRLSDGDWVKFTCEGMGEDRVVQVRLVYKDSHILENRFRISLDLSDWSSPSAIHAFEGAYFEQVKMPFELTTHDRFERSIEAPTFVNNSFEDDSKPARLLALLRALWAFQDSTGGRLPDQKDTETIVADLGLKQSLSPSDSAEMVSLLRTCSGNLSPICSFMGGVAGQEVLKACTGKFLPIVQWLMFAATDCLPLIPAPAPNSFGAKEGRYAGQISVFGTANQKKLGALRVLVVGAGALGCEILKNLALMGVSTQSEGGTTFVTDPDSIELSNLNRQFLFRSSTVGKNKAVCAAEAARRMNPAFQVQAFQQRVSADAQGAFTDTFWDSLDLVINALDNVPSRIFVDSQCVYYGKPLLESGTLGTKANTLPVIPHLTESYGSDPVKDFDATGEVPACTLHAYPNLFEHVLTWARDAVFEREFALDPAEAKAFVEAARGNSMHDLLASMQKQSNTIGSKVRAARSILVGILPEDNGEKLFPYTFATHGSRESLLQSSASSTTKNPVNVFTEIDCVAWARLKFQELFVNKIEALLVQHPADSKDGDQPYWTGKRRLPQPARFDPSDSHNVLFVVAGARLMARIHGLKEHMIDAQFVRATLRKSPPSLEPCTIASSATQQVSAGMEAEWRADVSRIEKVLSAMPDLKVEPCKFDKDDNVHVDLVWAAAVIRARNYRIPLLDRMEAKRVVGSIIPAIATTTAAATGLVALELYKVALLGQTDRHRCIETFRAYNFNLAVNSYAGFEPRPCATKFRVGTMACNLWSVVTLKGNLTVDELIEALQKRFRGLEVSSVTTVGDVTLFNDLFGGDDDGSALQTPISELFKRTVGRDPPEVFIPLTIDGDFEQDDDDASGDFVIPPIRLRWKDKTPDAEGY